MGRKIGEQIMRKPRSAADERLGESIIILRIF